MTVLENILEIRHQSKVQDFSFIYKNYSADIVAQTLVINVCWHAHLLHIITNRIFHATRFLQLQYCSFYISTAAMNHYILQLLKLRCNNPGESD